jgi:O-acetyl-ADP-ribose deacetylase (regulator of RNase III)
MGEGDEDRKLADAMTSVLMLATEKRFRSISVPAISAGIFGFPKDRCATILVGETVKFLATRETTLQTVEFCIFDRDAFGFFQDEIQKIGSA